MPSVDPETMRKIPFSSVKRGWIAILMVTASLLGAGKGWGAAVDHSFASRSRPESARPEFHLVQGEVPDTIPATGSVGRGDTTQVLSVDPVAVTVLRTSLSPVRVPAAVTLTDAAAASRTGPGLGLDDALRAIPGLQIDNRYNHSLGERVSIRGFGARAQFGVRGITVLVDGIPATLADGQTAFDHIDLSGIGRAEVLRGPSASIHGNAAGGVIQLESMEPPESPFRQELRVVGGSDGLLRVESRTGGTLGRGWYGVDLTRLRYDGYREHSSAENNYATARAGYRGNRDDLRLVLRFVDFEAENPGSLSDSLLALGRSKAFPNNVLQRTGKESRQLQVGGSWRRVLDHGSLEAAIYGLDRRVANPTPPQIIDLDRVAWGGRVVHQGTIGLGRGTVDGPGRALYWTLGLEGDRQRDDRQNHRNVEGAKGDLTLDQLESVTGIGVFARLGAPLTEHLTILGGLRWDHFDFRVRDRYTIAGDPDDSGRRAMSALSPSLGVVYRVGEASLYANFGSSFQTPTTTELANRPEGAGGFNPGIEPERTRSFEVGVRGALGGAGEGPRTRYQLALYHARTRDALIGFEVQSMPGRTFYRNAGSAVHRGLEVEGETRIMDDVALRISYALTDARFGRHRAGGDTLDGNLIPGVAPHRAEAVLAYQAAGWRAEAWARAVGETQADDRNSAAAPGYVLVGVRWSGRGIRIGDVDFEPIAGIDNLFDRDYVTALAVNAFGGRYYEPGPGRALFLGARLGVGGR